MNTLEQFSAIVHNTLLNAKHDLSQTEFWALLEEAKDFCDRELFTRFNDLGLASGHDWSNGDELLPSDV